MSKDKIYGYGIFFVTLVLMILYIIYLPIQYYFTTQVIAGDPRGPLFGLDLTWLVNLIPFLKVGWQDAVIWPVFLATMMIGFIIAWIGYTMATTPPPEPIDLDDLNLDEEIEEEAENDDNDD
ncbi:MAG: hypothetical protein ACFFFG_02410 [Candidatus Thorarchaeota archaeon]